MGGLIYDYRIMFSADGVFENETARGTLATSLDEQRIPIESVTARHMKIEFSKDAYDRPAASLAEINVETE